MTYSLEYQVQFVRDFIDTLKIQRAAFVGHSMGASLALKLALESPERVEKAHADNCLPVNG